MENINIARDFTDTPGGRYIKEGPYSGQLFRDSILKVKYDECRRNHTKIMIDLDGGYGYATSFLEEAFGGLARIYDANEILGTLDFKSDDEPELINEIIGYIKNGKNPKRKKR